MITVFQIFHWVARPDGFPVGPKQTVLSGFTFSIPNSFSRKPAIEAASGIYIKIKTECKDPF